ncbi:unnamed protein product [Sphenostylis stenocarpa]|uniref:Uncharacterized protein n=1 Tax=Sphenostylis stenocarpa TaxID=92480 RepID=A0AA86VTP4_9FABA|nr:unnamed protein product [Sphenostylis stenocarpa]
MAFFASHTEKEEAKKRKHACKANLWNRRRLQRTQLRILLAKKVTRKKVTEDHEREEKILESTSENMTWEEAHGDRRVRRNNVRLKDYDWIGAH